MIDDDGAREDRTGDDFEVWPENAETIRVFRALETQWNCVTDAKGLLVIGLRYEALDKKVWRACGVKRKRRDNVFRGLRVMELAAVPLLNERGGG